MKLLVLGANGMLGHKICQLFTNDWQVYGVVRNVQMPSFITDNINVITLTDFKENALEALLQSVKPDYVVNCLGVVKQKETETETLIRINALLPHVLARVCTRHDARLVQISTDCVFSGKTGNYAETDQPDPVDMYGYSKLMGEFSSDLHTVFRTSFIGFQLNGAWSLLEWYRTQKDVEVRGYTKSFFSGLTTLEFALNLKDILERAALKPGLYHLVSQPISKYELLVKLHKVLGIGIYPVRDEEVVINRSLNAALAKKEMNIQPNDWDTMIAALTNDIVWYR